MSVCTSTTSKMEILHELFAAATHDASNAMSRWTDGLIRLTLDEVREVPIESVCEELAIGDELMTMVVLTSPDDNFGGDMILTFDENNGRELAASLLQRPFEPGSEWSELEKSALTETGNILGCAYMNAITRLIQHDLVPSAPYFIQDYGASVLQQAIMPQAMTCDKLLICRTGFHREGAELNWRVLFVPTVSLRQAMENALHE